jgi:hypothetical protein
MTQSVLYRHEKVVHNEQAANIVLPLIFQLEKPSSVLDIGCGLGTWLSASKNLGVVDYLGVDGEYVNKDLLTIPLINFKAHDLRTPLHLNRKFDLAICLEVAEHLPESSSDVLVSSLVCHADKILFSAAVPGQGGQNHINEQWPEYWEKKFAVHGFYFHDTIRPLIWNNPNVDWWYRQNIFLLERKKPNGFPFNSLSVVHPELLALCEKNKHMNYHTLITGRQGMNLAIRIFVNSVLFKIKSLFVKS